MEWYVFEPDDEAYREADLRRFPQNPIPFRPVDREQKPRIRLEDDKVLEVRKTDGTRQKYVKTQGPVECRYNQVGNQFRIPAGYPVAWLWVKPKSQPEEGPGIRYKAPTQWVEKDGYLYCSFGVDPSGLELVGDRDGFLAAAYWLHRC